MPTLLQATFIPEQNIEGVWVDGLQRMVQDSMKADPASKGDASDAAATFVSQIKNTYLQLMGEEEGKESQEGYELHLSCSVIQRKVDTDATFTTMPHCIGHHSLYWDGNKNKFVKMPLHQHGVWSHYYTNTNDIIGNLVFGSHGSAVFGPLSMCHMAGHITHIEGNPYLFFTVLSACKKKKSITAGEDGESYRPLMTKALKTPKQTSKPSSNNGRRNLYGTIRTCVTPALRLTSN
ncbi:hypothetical protein SEMRO_821_G207340.1 [Seminavis robusta]|uniref:Uncharacterized protein n=1 Tax=Seminavis robusta TaxID=568900 RepID=A0A9N8HLM6_9STRA|nr:hypothetical protein SEMRO_821_G207330.1 [Seminavis robusta]CAB9517000.1 hypothetical protein SEMRO_821_G207340.1 [Seminavis robusta]|eukprot:Sro821_g207330.1 n/a (235) ;mRNA; r:9518-10222